LDSKSTDHDDPAPALWLRANTDLIARDQTVLDVACGRGRHALWLARHGWRVHAIDRDAAALAAIDAQANASRLPLTTECCDLEVASPDLGIDRYGAIIVFNYLHRPLFPLLIRALRPDGVLIYETFTIGQRERGHPKNPSFLLEEGELARRLSPLVILRSREGDFDGKLLASVAARKPLPVASSET
jgi:SAM-dependent methyltransferase